MCVFIVRDLTSCYFLIGPSVDANHHSDSLVIHLIQFFCHLFLWSLENVKNNLYIVSPNDVVLTKILGF